MLDLPRRRFDMAPNRKRDPRSDEALVAICNEGDARSAADAFDALYRRHKDFVEANPHAPRRCSPPEVLASGGCGLRARC